MGRLPTLALSVVAGFGCTQEPKGSTTRERSEIVKATESAPAPPPSSVPPAGDVTRAAAVPRKLCEGQLAKAGRDVPKKPLSRKAALGARSVGPKLATGKWTWVNLWAAWCAPCKEEMPRLLSLAARLPTAPGDFGLAFVSLDDDERQLEQFLAAQPDAGVRATFWLREGHERDEWLQAAGLGRDPSLPVQLLVDAKGKIRCTVNGAVADQDLAEIASIVAGP
jgi:thiol-disulfide isomerase/thioredoxin